MADAVVKAKLLRAPDMVRVAKPMSSLSFWRPQSAMALVKPEGRSRQGYCGALLLVLLTGCASTPVTLEMVGPAPASARQHAPGGYLVVYSATDNRAIGDGPLYHPHTGYLIYSESGEKLQSVLNHAGDMDEVPQIVRLPAGSFHVRAEAEGFGWVTVPVVIHANKTTEVRLDATWTDSPSAGPHEIVCLPDGKMVGWKAHDVPSR